MSYFCPNGQLTIVPMLHQTAEHVPDDVGLGYIADAEAVKLGL